MKLTPDELNKINKIAGLAELCRLVIDISEYGPKKEYLADELRGVTVILKKQHPVFKLIIP